MSPIPRPSLHQLLKAPSLPPTRAIAGTPARFPTTVKDPGFNKVKGLRLALQAASLKSLAKLTARHPFQTLSLIHI